MFTRIGRRTAWGPAVVLCAILSACATERGERTSFRPIEDEAIRTAFRAAQDAFDRKDYAAAAGLYQDIIETHPGSDLLMEAQWMVARSEEMQGKWKRALLQYESFSRNYPREHSDEVRVRIQLLRELLEERPGERVYPPIRAILTSSPNPPDSALDAYGRRGLNAVAVDAADDSIGLPPEQVASIHRRGMTVFALVRLDLRDLFERDKRRMLQRLCAEVGVRGMDGVFFEATNGTVEEWFRRDIMDQFEEAFGTEADAERLIGEAALYWQWAGWRGRTIMQELEEVVRPAKSIRADFYWGILFPAEAVTNPHIVLSRSGLDLVEAKTRNLDYFGIALPGNATDSMILRRVRDLVGNPNRIIGVASQSPGEMGSARERDPEYGIFYLNHRVRSD